jgi:hypothetical protein
MTPCVANGGPCEADAKRQIALLLFVKWQLDVRASWSVGSYETNTMQRPGGATDICRSRTFPNSSASGVPRILEQEPKRIALRYQMADCPRIRAQHDR